MTATRPLPWRTRLHIRVVLLRSRWESLAWQHRWARPLGWLARRWYRLERGLQGARDVETADLGETNGSLHEGGLEIEFGGACPVQGFGRVDGLPCYYRSRGEGWQFHVASWPNGDPLNEDAWEYFERPYFFPQGGWVSPRVSVECIRRAVSLYRAARALREVGLG